MLGSNPNVGAIKRLSHAIVLGLVGVLGFVSFCDFIIMSMFVLGVA